MTQKHVTGCPKPPKKKYKSGPSGPSGDHAKPRIFVSVTEETHAALTSVAQSRGLPLATLCAEILEADAKLSGYKLWVKQCSDGWHIVDEHCSSLDGPFPTEQRALFAARAMVDTVGT